MERISGKDFIELNFDMPNFPEITPNYYTVNH